jgi:hypothetical protein
MNPGLVRSPSNNVAVNRRESKEVSRLHMSKDHQFP